MVELKQDEALEELFGDKKIIQNTKLYRFTSDSILLSRFARAKKGDVVADFCAGCGAVGYHFLCLNPSISSLTLFELQPALADMAERTALLNGFPSRVVAGRFAGRWRKKCSPCGRGAWNPAWPWCWWATIPPARST